MADISRASSVSEAEYEAAGEGGADDWLDTLREDVDAKLGCSQADEEDGEKVLAVIGVSNLVTISGTWYLSNSCIASSSS